MLYGVFSDVHADIEYLELALSLMKQNGVESYICLGDIVGRGYNPSETIQRIQLLNSEEDTQVIQGNHDYEVAHFDPENIECMSYTMIDPIDIGHHNQLSNSDLNYLSSLPLTFSNEDMECVHGSLPDPHLWTYISLNYDMSGMYTSAENVFKVMTSPLLFCGHTHQPQLYVLNEKGYARGLSPCLDWFDLSDVQKVICDAGSISDPRDDFGKTCVLFDSEKNRLKFLSMTL